MGKDYTVNDTRNLMLRLNISTPSDPVSKSNEDGETEYFAAVQLLQCQAIGDDGLKKPCHIPRKYYGAAKDRPWTPQEVGTALKNFNNFNTVIYNDVKSLFKNSSNENIS